MENGLIILDNITIKEMKETLEIQINQEIYFLNENTNEVFELYEINNVKVFRTIGVIEENLQFMWKENPNLLERRKDFQGIQLIGMTEAEQRSIFWNATDLTKETTPYFSNNDTHLVNNIVHGTYIDVLKFLESKHNFSVQLFKRGDESWGSVKMHPNGTLEAKGMLSDLLLKKADMIVTSLAIVSGRFPHIGNDQ